MHLLGVSDFLKCITLIFCVLVYFDARFLGQNPESNYFFFFLFVLHVLAYVYFLFVIRIL
jgi:hypothetical protein